MQSSKRRPVMSTARVKVEQARYTGRAALPLECHLDACGTVSVRRLRIGAAWGVEERGSVVSYRMGSRVELLMESDSGDCLVRCTECGLLLAASSAGLAEELRGMLRDLDADHREWCADRKGGPYAA